MAQSRPRLGYFGPYQIIFNSRILARNVRVEGEQADHHRGPCPPIVCMFLGGQGFKPGPLLLI